MVETQLCKLRDASDTFVGRSFGVFYSYQADVFQFFIKTPPNKQMIQRCGTTGPFFVARFFLSRSGSNAPKPVCRRSVLERLQSLVSRPTPPRTSEEVDKRTFISLLRAVSTLGASGASILLLLTCFISIYHTGVVYGV